MKSGVTRTNVFFIIYFYLRYGGHLQNTLLLCSRKRRPWQAQLLHNLLRIKLFEEPLGGCQPRQGGLGPNVDIYRITIPSQAGNDVA